MTPTGPTGVPRTMTSPSKMKTLQSFRLGPVFIDWRDYMGGFEPVIQARRFDIMGPADTELAGVFAHGDELWAVTTRGEPPEPPQEIVLRVTIYSGPSLEITYCTQHEIGGFNGIGNEVYYAGTVIFDRRTCPQQLLEPMMEPGRIAGYLAIGHVMVEDLRGKDRAGGSAFRVRDPKDRPRRMITL